MPVWLYMLYMFCYIAFSGAVRYILATKKNYKISNMNNNVIQNHYRQVNITKYNM